MDVNEDGPLLEGVDADLHGQGEAPVPGEDAPRDAGDAAALADLARLVEAVDPAPTDLAERVVFELTVEALRESVLEMERISTPELVGRGAEEREMVRVSTITFASDPVTVMITVSESPTGGLCIDGWAAPADQYRIEVYRPGGYEGTSSDEDGRFTVFDVPSGPTCLALRRADGEGPTVCTPVIEL